MLGGSRAVVGETIDGRYELEELVGTGGMSSVFRARDRMLERNVALKILHDHFADDDEYVGRFRREARAVAQLSHPHIVTVIDRGQDEGREYIVFEYVDGENLKELVRRSGPLPVRRALELAIAIAEGLAFAHAQGVVHRDVKPQNVLLGDEGDVKVTDFGIARTHEMDTGVTQTGTVLGTSTYISPEQAGGKGVTPATDVYSLGIVLWELLAGDVPFPGDNFVTVALRHINEPPPSLLDVRTDVPPRLAAAVDRALAKQPADRFPSMEAFEQELRRCLGELDAERTVIAPPQASTPALPPRPQQTYVRHAPVRRRRAGRGRWIALLVVALLALAAIVAGVIGLGGGGRPSSSGGGGGGGGGTASSGAPVSLTGVTTYDPQGNGNEHSSTAPAATDGNPSTSWYTETYQTPNFGGLKDGVGLVLDAGSAVAVKSLTVTTPTPGFQAKVMTGAAQGGPFTSDSATQTVSGTTTFDLSGPSARYYVLWITRLPPGGRAEVSEVEAKR
jgi:eukaryotic-like serine/threonine-protein kinase